MSRRKKWVAGLGIVALILAAYVLVSPYILPWYEHRRVEHLLADFRVNPGKVTIEPLIQTLYDGRASQADGEAVLGELLMVKRPKSSILHFQNEDQAPGRCVCVNVDLCHPEIGLHHDFTESILSGIRALVSTQLSGHYSSTISFVGNEQGVLPSTNPTSSGQSDDVYFGFGNTGTLSSSRPGQKELEVGAFAAFKPGTYKGTIAVKFEIWRFTPTWQPTPWYENVLKRLGLVRDRAPEKPRIYRCQSVLPFEAQVGKDAWGK